MKVICNRSNECKEAKCPHYGTHKTIKGNRGKECDNPYCADIDKPVECIEDIGEPASKIRPIRFELIE